MLSMSHGTAFFQKLSTLPLLIKKLVSVGVDLILIPTSLWLAISFRLGSPFERLDDTFLVFSGLTVFTIPVFARLGLYRTVMRYAGRRIAEQTALGVLVSSGILLALMLMQGQQTIPRSSFLIYGFVAFVLIGGTRFLAHKLLGGIPFGNGNRVAIYGAGASGTQLLQLLRRSHEYHPVVFIDDSPRLYGREIDGLAVLYPQAGDLAQRLLNLGVEEILLSIPSAPQRERQRIIERLEPMPFPVRTVPGVQEIVSGKVGLDDIREIPVEDLLRRECVLPEEYLLSLCIRDKTVLVTGAGGSIGSELCRQILDRAPFRLLLLEVSEFALYRIEQELHERIISHKLDVELVPLLGNVTDESRVSEIFRTVHVDTVYHAAAYKHVPLVEQNPVQGLRNNVLGTRHVARHAAMSRVGHFVLISTDKAVRPTSVMGVSKRLSELVIQALQPEYPDTTFSMVRFGNVLGSSGSVVPLFRKQIREGGPITVTHSEITRFFMTIPEAVQLVIQAGAMANGGDVFVLDMGEPVKIATLARRLIQLSGLTVCDADNPDGDLEIKFTGLRPGEKLYEELLIADNVAGTDCKKILRAQEPFVGWNELEPLLNELDGYCRSGDLSATRKILSTLAPEYVSHPDFHDWIWKLTDK